MMKNREIADEMAQNIFSALNESVEPNFACIKGLDVFEQEMFRNIISDAITIYFHKNHVSSLR